MDELQYLECHIKMPLMSLPVRTTIARLQNAVVMISPGSQLQLKDLKSVPGVTDIVAPNLLHCGGMLKAIEAFPQARVWGPLGAKDAKPEIPWTHQLVKGQWLYDDELKLIPLQGMPRFNECLFVHKKSKTLIVADLFFNMDQAAGIGSWIIMNIFGTYRKFAMSRLFAKFITDKEAFTTSAQEILEQDFSKIAVGHGNLLVAGPPDVLKALQKRGYKP